MTLHIHITGFGAFGSVKNNPSSILCGKLPSFLHQRQLSTSSSSLSTSHNNNQPLYVIESTQELEVSTVDVDQYIHKLYSNARNTETNATHLMLHLGVLAGQKMHQFERTGANESSFRIPDARGFQPMNQLVNESEIAPAALHTQLNLPIICQAALQGVIDRELKQMHGADEESEASSTKRNPLTAKVSDNAGRYLCNYLLYQSLFFSAISRALGYNHHAFFLHVPAFTDIDENRQLNFLADVIQIVAEMHHESNLLLSQIEYENACAAAALELTKDGGSNLDSNTE